MPTGAFFGNNSRVHTVLNKTTTPPVVRVGGRVEERRQMAGDEGPATNNSENLLLRFWGEQAFNLTVRYLLN